MCGHNGLPGSDPEPVNHVRLVLVDTGEVIAKEIPPRNDTAQKYEWTLKEHAGKEVVFEMIDAFRATGYAWLAAGRFEPAVIRVPSADSEKEDARLVSLAGRFGLKETSPKLLELASGSAQPVALRVAAIESADKTTERAELLKLLTAIVARGDEPNEIRAKAAGLLGTIDADEARGALVAAIAQAPTALERNLALALCQNQAGMKALVDALVAGKASAQLLNDPNVAELLTSRAADADKARVAEMKQNLPPADERLAKLIALHRERFAADKASADRGRELFTKHCGACHRIGPEGAMVGPQLDGVGNRGLDRVLEDVLDPNRNVDAAFRTSLITTVDGKVYTGLERREGEIVVIADALGKEIRIPAADIEEQRRTELSLMPANFSEVLKPSEVQDLVGFLLSQRQAAE